MRKCDVISYFGNQSRVAEALGISYASITQWKDIIPESRAYQIEHITNHALNADYYRNKLKAS